MARPGVWQTYVKGNPSPGVSDIVAVAEVDASAVPAGSTLVRTIIDVDFRHVENDVPLDFANFGSPIIWGLALLPALDPPPTDVLGSTVDWVWSQGVQWGQPMIVTQPLIADAWESRSVGPWPRPDGEGRRFIHSDGYTWWFRAVNVFGAFSGFIEVTFQWRIVVRAFYLLP